MPAGAPRKTNLRRPGNSFVGREATLAELSEIFGSARLCTIVGPPGSGKTRLAIEYGLAGSAELADAASGGVWLCELSDAATALDLGRAIGRVLDIGLIGDRGGEVDARIGAALAARGPMLLVLDNLEQLVHIGAPIVQSWLDAAPELLVLATSRERLGLPEERVLEIGPLGLPDSSGDAGGEAVQLFVDRVTAAHRGWRLAEQDREAILELTRRLDGLPLAIELAAARMTVLGPRQLLDRLDLDVLGGDRSIRRSSLRVTLDWSWQHLLPDEQRALLDLSVFRGGLSLEAAEAVVDLARPRVLEVLQALRDKSLLAASEAAELPGEARFALLQVIRTYAAERLDADPSAAAGARERHARYYLTAARSWAVGVDRAEGPTCLRRLAVELPNLLDVHRRALSGGRPEDALSILLALEPLFFKRGPTTQCLALLTETLEAAEGRAIDSKGGSVAVLPARRPIDTTTLALALKARGRALRDLGRLPEARDVLERALEVARAAGDRGSAGRVLAHLASLATSDPTRARAGFEDALAEVRAAGDARTAALIAGTLAEMLRREGRSDAAARAYDEALAALRAQHDLYGEAATLSSRAELSRARGRTEAARSDLERALELFQRFGERRYEGMALADLGVLHLEQGDLDGARRLLEQACTCHGEYGSRWLEAAALGTLADLEREAARFEEATRLYREAAGVARDAADTAAEARWLAGMASIEAASARCPRAEQLLAEARSVAGAAPDPVLALLLDVHSAIVGAAQNNERDGTAAALVDRADRLPEQPAGVRSALRFLRASQGAERPAAIAEATLLVGDGGRWFEVSGGARVSLQRRHALRLVLSRLVRQRLDAPGRALDVPALLEAGWPGEKVRVQAGLLRVYNALSTLRRMGLRQVVQSRDDGYLIDPQVRVSESGEG